MLYTSRIIRHILIGIGVCILLGIGTVLVVSFPKKPLITEPGERLPDLGNDHIADLAVAHGAYNSVPPTSGPHLPRIAMWGVSTIQIPDELQVHNLEDGGVIIHYDPLRLDGTTIEKIQKLVSTFPQYVISEPYATPSLPAPIVVTAWTRIQKFDTYDEEKIKIFIDAYKGIDHHKEK